MKRPPLDYWQKLRQRSLTSNPLKRTGIKKKANQSDKNVPLAKVGKPESLGRLIQRAVTVFHKWIRERDSSDGMFECISCWKYLPVDQMQCGHFLPAGNNGVIRFNEHCCNGQCVECNCFKDGNQENYRVGLISKIGLENVEALEAMAKRPHKWDRAELERIIVEYS